MSYYRYCHTLGESSTAIVVSARQRALQREVIAESVLLLCAALVALTVAARLVGLNVALHAQIVQLLAGLPGWL
ncbi:MAG TPA: hypothetical protein VGP33_07995 [Chloroflexota bacterium]|nr:hypothetical protein [Chloroflexota bacterium]